MNVLPLWMRATLARLSERERHVLRLISSGRSGEAAAQELGCPPEQIEADWEAICERFRHALRRAAQEPFLWRAVG